MVIVVETVHHITFHLKLWFRSFKEILKKPASVLLKASAAGITAVLRPGTFHKDLTPAAASLRIMNTRCHSTIQLCHKINLLFLFHQRSLCAERSRNIRASGIFSWIGNSAGIFLCNRRFRGIPYYIKFHASSTGYFSRFNLSISVLLSFIRG